MYTIVENARITIALLKAHNIRHIVLSPGGSNIPIVQGVQDDPFFECYSVVDERSAMYVAIGIYLQTGEPVATSCTSAQATRNYIPGLTEAYYKHVPILAITMSKHPKFLGQEYMQCPVQTSLPIDAVKKSFNLPIINSDDDRQLCIRVANEAILELTHHSLGPVQLNLEALDSETWILDEHLTLPNPRIIRRYNFVEDTDFSFLKGKKILIVVGEHRPFSEKEISAIEAFASSYDVAIYSLHLSNYHGRYAINGERCLLCSTYDYYNEVLNPDIVITIGGITGDYVLFNKFTQFSTSKTEVWRVATDGDVVDTYGKLTRIYEMTYESFFKKLSLDTPLEEHSYYQGWYNSLVDLEDIELPFGNVYAAQQLHNVLPSNSILNFAILNSLRSWMHFDIDPSIICYSNVAAFGIDGCLSTLLGQSFCTNKLCFLITGDLSFYYDMNSLAIRHISNNVRILLINNNGGAEFKLNTIHEQTDVSRYIAADDHFKNGQAWAESNNFLYLSASNKNEFVKNKHSFLGKSTKPILFELFTTGENEKQADAIICQACWKGTEKEQSTIVLKRKVKSVFENIKSKF